MYLGLYRVSLRAKNRVAFPAKFKEITGNQLLISNWFENSLMILPKPEWMEFVNTLFKNTSVLSSEVRDLERFIFGGTHEVELDREGRFVLPQELVEHAKISKKAVFVGGLWGINIWDEEVFESQRAVNSLQIRDKAKKLFESLNKNE